MRKLSQEEKQERTVQDEAEAWMQCGLERGLVDQMERERARNVPEIKPGEV